MPRIRTRVGSLLPSLGTLAAFAFVAHVSLLGAQEHAHPAGKRDRAAPPATKPVRATLLPGLGTWHMSITTASPRAARFFDQGLRLAYAFNHEEAERSFAEAARLDPSCAMCHWGIAYAAGPNMNLPVSPEAEARASAAIAKATRIISKATPRERGLIAAMTKRVSAPAGADRAARDSAYAGAMRDLLARFPDDPDMGTLFADAMINLRPWKQWTQDGQPEPGTIELVSVLENAIARQPRHAGACHFYVHAVEASSTPERALPCAAALPKLMPGAGHLVHMPAHVYLRVGRYGDAARANIAAVEADKRYFGRTGRSNVPVYSLMYAAHNTHFLWAAYMLSGQGTRAMGEARALRRAVPIDAMRAMASLEAYIVTPLLTAARYGRWDALLAEPVPAAEFRYWRGIRHYTRGLAFLARNDATAAASELDLLRAVAAETPANVVIIQNTAPALLDLAAVTLAGELALLAGRADVGIAHLRDAVRREDALAFDEPPAWYHSSRHRLGIALLAMGRAGDAEETFREDLRAYRENGFALAGLEQALRSQGRDVEAAAVAARLKAAWAEADAPVTAPRRAAR